MKRTQQQVLLSHFFAPKTPTAAGTSATTAGAATSPAAAPAAAASLPSKSAPPSGLAKPPAKRPRTAAAAGAQRSKPKAAAAEDEDNNSDADFQATAPLSPPPATTTARGTPFNENVLAGLESRKVDEMQHVRWVNEVALLPGTGDEPGHPFGDDYSVHQRDSDSEGDSDGSAGPKKPAGRGGAVKHTPLEQQVVELKRAHPGVLLFVECGYKYRFFGDDAVNAARVLGIYAHKNHSFMTASVPVHRLGVHVRRLVSAGYKVGVVQQTETAAIKAAGSNKSAPFTRDLTGLYTMGTLVDDDVIGASTAGGDHGERRFILCIVDAVSSGSISIGIIAFDVGSGSAIVDSFADSNLFLELESRLRHIDPVEILYSTSVHPDVKHVVERFVAQKTPSVAAVPAAAPADAPEGEESAGGSGPAAEMDAGQCSIRVESIPASWTSLDASARNIMSGWANVSVPARGAGSAALIIGDRSFDKLEVCALGGLWSYLRAFKLTTLLQSASFAEFSTSSHMFLDGIALRDLDIISSQATGGMRGSLLWVLSHTRSPFGQRRLIEWVRRPLQDADAINARLDAVSELAGLRLASGIVGAKPACVMNLVQALAGVPDLEKRLSRIAQTAAAPGEVLPTLFLLHRIAQELPSSATVAGNVQSALLQSLLNSVPDVSDQLAAVLTNIQPALAERLRNAKPSAKPANVALIDLFSPTYEAESCPAVLQARSGIASVERQLQEELLRVRQVLRNPTMEYRTLRTGFTSELEYLIELPLSAADTVPDDWRSVSSTKSLIRYHTPMILKLLPQLAYQRETLEQECKRAWTCWLERLGTVLYRQLRQLVYVLAELDCVHSLSIVAVQPGYCRPTLLEADDVRINIQAARHPMAELSGSAELSFAAPAAGQGALAFVPNPVQLGGTFPKTMIVTGPNMGGKSSFVRTVCLITIMAQIGSYVPASSAELTPVDGVFTRMGAADDLLAGKSTFMVELGQASNILQKATSKSLIIMDELGRGTATFDGTAIAYATCHFLMTSLKSLTLFITHYPEVTTLANEHPALAVNKHLSYIESDPEPGTDELPRVTFLYSLADGPAPGSYGLNVARLAGLPKSVLDRARHKSATWHQSQE